MILYQPDFHVFSLTGNLYFKGYVLEGTPVQITVRSGGRVEDTKVYGSLRQRLVNG